MPSKDDDCRAGIQSAVDAASRLTANNSPRSAAAWFVGDLAGTTGDSLDYDPANISTNLPPGSVMTPGIVNRKPPRLTPNPLLPMTGVIGAPAIQSVKWTCLTMQFGAVKLGFCPDNMPQRDTGLRSLKRIPR